MAKTKYQIPSPKELFDAGVHFGHKVRRWHPQMEQFIYAVRKNTHIINLEKTEQFLDIAAQELHKIVSEGGKVIFVGTKRQAREIIETEAQKCGAMFVTERWLGGTLTNHTVIKKNIKKLLDLKRQREEGELVHYTKKERLLIDREIEKLERYYGGLTTLKGLPQALFIIDPKREKTAVREANKAGIPVFALTDTNTDPTGIDYLIPGNDDGLKSIALITKVVSDVVVAGLEAYTKSLEKKDQSASTEKQKFADDDKKAKETTSESEEKAKINVTGTESPVATKEAGVTATKKALEPATSNDVDIDDSDSDEAESNDKPKTSKTKKVSSKKEDK